MKEEEFMDLSDIEVELKIRSGKSDMASLQKILNDIVSSSVLSFESYIELTEVEVKANKTPDKNLNIIFHRYSTKR